MADVLGAYVTAKNKLIKALSDLVMRELGVPPVDLELIDVEPRLVSYKVKILYKVEEIYERILAIEKRKASIRNIGITKCIKVITPHEKELILECISTDEDLKTLKR